MSENEDFDFTESEEINPLFVTGLRFDQLDEHTGRIVGWVDLPCVKERRMVMRVGLSLTTAEQLYIELWRALRGSKRALIPVK